MMKSKINALLCENEILEELMSIPVAEILSYSNKADLVNPEDALRYLSEMYIDNCGISTGMRSFADYCAVFWIKRLKSTANTDMQDKYKDAFVLVDFLPFLSDEYSEEIDEYDICFMSDTDLRAILIDELNNDIDDKAKIIYCAGVCDILPELSDDRWLDNYSMEKIEDGIINLKSKILIQHRRFEKIKKYFPPTKVKDEYNIPENYRKKLEHPPYPFSKEEVRHFELLNKRLVELQNGVMKQVRDITLNLQEQISNGFHQYESFNVEGLIYIEDMEDDVESLLNILADHAKYTVITTNDSITREVMDEIIAWDIHLYNNWCGIFHQLETEHGLKVCRAFRQIFEEARVFTVEDIMKITPEMLFTQVKIYI